MPSLQARGFGLVMRVYMRRRHWGDERTLARRARRIFGAPRTLQWLRTRGVRIEGVRDGDVYGEWIVPGAAGHGVVLYMHGGGYVAGSAATDRPITAALARLAQRRVFSLEYRLAPEHRFPAALDDAVAAHRWLLGQGIEPRALVLAGLSAGGGLVLATLLRLRDEGVPLPASAVCFSPWTDLAGTGESLRANDGRCSTLRAANIPDFAQVYLGSVPALTPYASPAFADVSRLPPLLLQVGSVEVLLDDARRMHDRVRRAGGPSRLDVVEGAFHGWQMYDGFMPEAGTALQRAAAFMNETARDGR